MTWPTLAGLAGAPLIEGALMVWSVIGIVVLFYFGKLLFWLDWKFRGQPKERAWIKAKLEMEPNWIPPPDYEP